MINRFHSASPSAVALTTGSQAKKINVGDGFSEILNALVNPVQQTEGQTPESLLEEQKVNLEIPDAGIPFHLLIGSTDTFVELAAANVLVPPTLAIPVMLMDSSLLTPIVMPTGSDLLQADPVGLERVNNENRVLPSFSTGMESTAIQSPIPRNAETGDADLYMPIVSPIQSPTASETLTTSTMAAETITMLDAATPVRVVAFSDAKETTPEPGNGEIRISKHASAVVGDVELVSMPWHLQANAALSYQSTAERLQNTENASNETGMLLQKTPVRASDKSQLPNMAGYAALFENSEMDKSLAFYRVSETASTLASVFENARISRADSRASLVMWPQRVLHWLSDGDATTAWVRDYTLDAASTGTLVEALRCFSEQQGFTLRRIMLNGHEVWRAPSNF